MIYPTIAAALMDVMTREGGIKVASLAKDICVTRQTVYDWLSGTYEPSAEHLSALETRFKCTISKQINLKTA